jgi:hypothetical protein
MAVEACPFVEWFIDRFRDCVQRIDIADADCRTTAHQLVVPIPIKRETYPD